MAASQPMSRSCGFRVSSRLLDGRGRTGAARLPSLPIAVLAALAAAIVARSTGADPPPVTNKPAYSIGEWWQYTERRLRQSCVQWVVVEADSAGSLVEECDGHQVHRDYASDLELVKVTRAGEDAVTFDSPLRELSFPLEVGKTWQQSYRGYTADNEVRWAASASWAVTAYESVTVAAGTFDAYRIERTETWGPEMYHLGVHAISWWAPAAKAFVKRTHQDGRWESELEAYGPPPSP